MRPNQPRASVRSVYLGPWPRHHFAVPEEVHTWTVPKVGEETDPVTVPKIDPETVPETVPKIDPETVPVTVPKTDPQTVPMTDLETVPKTMSLRTWLFEKGLQRLPKPAKLRPARPKTAPPKHLVKENLARKVITEILTSRFCNTMEINDFSYLQA